MITQYHSTIIYYYHTVYECTSSMYVWSRISKSMDQPGEVANPAHGQLNREN